MEHTSDKTVPFQNGDVEIRGGSPGWPQLPSVRPKKQLDTASIEESNWFAAIQQNIRKAEYQISQVERESGEAPAVFHAANRAQNLRASFSKDGIKLAQRSKLEGYVDIGLEPGNVPGVEIRLAAVGRETSTVQTRPISPGFYTAEEMNSVAYEYPTATARYINSEAGVTEEITVAALPRGQGRFFSIRRGHKRPG